MTDCQLPELLNLPRIERSLTYGGSLYGLSKSIALQAVVSNQQPREQRKYPRYRPDITIYILHSTLGMVTDISLDGLSYSYRQMPGRSAGPLPETGTLFSAERGVLKDIPLTFVQEAVNLESSSCLPELRQRQISFKDLTAAQCEMLEEFILKHISIPKLDGNNDQGWFQTAQTRAR